MLLSPRALAAALTLSNPEFVMAGSTNIRTSLLDMVSDTLQFSGLVQWLQENPTEAAPVAQALQPSDPPSTVPVPLPEVMLESLGAVWSTLEDSAFQDSTLENVLWTIQDGVAPSREPVSPNDGGWRLAPFGSAGDISIGSITYTRDRTLSLQLMNRAPRHVSAYATFVKDGAPVVPEGWISRLPKGVSAVFETDTMKYVAILTPDIPVSAFPVDVADKGLVFAIPSNADRAELKFGGLGIDCFEPLTAAAGAMLTYALDFVAPWIASRYPDAEGSAKWYKLLLADGAIRDAVIQSGEFIVASGAVGSVPALLDYLAANFTGIFLSETLKPLRDSIDKQFTPASTKNGKPGASSLFAATAGWPAQIARLLIQQTPPTQWWPGSVNAGVHVDLSPATSAALTVSLLPDPKYFSFPFASASAQVTIGYGDENAGFSQARSVPAQASSPSIPVVFGSVRNAGLFRIDATLSDGEGRLLATGRRELRDDPVIRSNRDLSTLTTLNELPVAIAPGAVFVAKRSLTYAGGSYIWGAPVAPLERGPLALMGITLQEDQQAFGYVWNAAGQSRVSCSGGGPAAHPYVMQNAGTIDAVARLKTIECGFVSRPYLAYGGSRVARGIFVDPRGSVPYIRAIDFEAGRFDLQQALSYGAFREAQLDSVAIHSSGFAIAVSSISCRMEIVKLTEAPVADARAPLSRVFCGSGARQGLLLNPVAVCVSPGGDVLVLEQGNQRVQAFDTSGNNVALFQGSQFLRVELPTGAGYRDLAVSQAGYVFVLWSDADGVTCLDVVGPDGVRVSRTAGLGAGKIAADARNSVFALDFATIIGKSGQAEPSITVWEAAI